MSNPFAMKVPLPGQGGFADTPPAGTHQAVLVAIIDLGTQMEDYQGEQKKARKVFLAWELVQERAAGMPHGHVIGKQYTLSYHQKAALRGLIKGWRGKDLADGEEFDLAKLKGKSCLVNVTHSTSGERTYANLGGVSPLPKGMPAVEPGVEPVLWYIGSDEPFPDAAWLPWSYGERLEEILNRSDEMKVRAPAGAAPPAGSVAGDGDTIPF